jgi:DNA-directed RNA polymerase specialized sigma24 family protein
MIGMLFYADPPVPYQDVASRLGLAVGSIGFIRGRCLQKLQKLLESEGLV